MAVVGADDATDEPSARAWRRFSAVARDLGIRAAASIGISWIGQRSRDPRVPPVAAINLYSARGTADLTKPGRGLAFGVHFGSWLTGRDPAELYDVALLGPGAIRRAGREDGGQPHRSRLSPIRGGSAPRARRRPHVSPCSGPGTAPRMPTCVTPAHRTDLDLDALRDQLAAQHATMSAQRTASAAQADSLARQSVAIAAQYIELAGLVDGETAEGYRRRACGIVEFARHARLFAEQETAAAASPVGADG